MADNPSSNKKQAILSNALTLFVNQGIHATSTASIAKTACVANGTLFHHFGSKDDLVLALYKSIKQDFALKITPLELTPVNLKNQVEQIWNQAIDWAITNADKQQFCLLVSQYQSLSAQVRDQVLAEEFGYLQQLIIFGQQHGVIAQYPLALIVDNAHGQFLTSSQFFINNPKVAHDKKYRCAVFNMFWHAFAVKNE